jgi:hypothetical protein
VVVVFGGVYVDEESFIFDSGCSRWVELSPEEKELGEEYSQQGIQESRDLAIDLG